MPETLQVAARRIRELLELGPALALVLLVGPPFRAEEALSAVASAATPERPQIVHRLHVDGPGLDDAGGAAEGPVVLAYGLEYMTPARREELLRGLNWRRDRLRLHPAVYLVWIPRGLASEFAGHCQDLFDWRELMMEVEPETASEQLVLWRELLTRGLLSNQPRHLRLFGAIDQIRVPEPDVDLRVRPLGKGAPVWFTIWAGSIQQGCLTGPSATGKTTALRRLARVAAEEALQSTEQTTGTLALRLYARDLLLNASPLGDAVCRPLALERAGPYIERWAAEGRLLLLIDAVDEVEAAAQDLIWSHLKAWRAAFPRLRVVTTVRDRRAPPPGWEVVEPLPWTPDDALQYLRQRGMSEAGLEAIRTGGAPAFTPLLAELCLRVWQELGRVPSDKMSLLDLVLPIPTDPALEIAAAELLDSGGRTLSRGTVPHSTNALEVLETLGVVDLSANQATFHWRFAISWLAARGLVRGGREAILDRWRRSSEDPRWSDALRMALTRLFRDFGVEGWAEEAAREGANRGDGSLSLRVLQEVLAQVA